VSDAAFSVRSYRPEDEERVIALLRQALGNGRAFERTSAFWQWKHFQNPFGESLLTLAENGEIMGLRAFMRWQFRVGSRTLRAVRAVDTATHPAFRRFGVFSTLTRHTVERARADGVDLIFNTPNRYSLPGYLKLGWVYVGRPRLLVKVLRPGRMVLSGLRARSRQAVAGVPVVPAAMRFSSAEGLARTLEEDGRHTIEGIRTDRSVSFLHWRYGVAPTLPYYIHAQQRDAAVVVIFRPNLRRGMREIMISELLLGAGAGHDATAAIRGIAGAVDADYLLAHAALGSAHDRVLTRAGFRRLPVVGPHFVAHPLSPEAVTACVHPDRWRLSLGDLEVF